MHYRVIWFDDEHESLVMVKNEAKENDIELIGFKNADDGLLELEKDMDFFDAVLVDGRFYNKRDHTGDTSFSEEAFVRVARELDRLERRKKIPWFILSGHPSFTVDLNPFAQAFRDNRVYNKNRDEDYVRLWHDIKQEANKQEETQIRYKYKVVFEVCSESYIGKNAAKHLLEILKKEKLAMDFLESDLYFNAIRKIMEDFFKACIDKGILPSEFASPTLALNEAGKFFSGSIEKGYQISDSNFPGKIVSQSIRAILAVCQPASHRGDIDMFLKKVQSPYLLYSVTYQLLNLLVWLKVFVDENSDYKTNTQLWRRVEEQMQNDIIGILKYDGQNYYVNDCIILKTKIEGIYKVGDKIRITRFSKNQNEKSKQYQYFANTFVKTD
jgi:hypothetical protein